MMRNKIYILVLLVSTAITPLDVAQASSKYNKEYQIKAAFLYNFVKFVDWPKEKVADSNDVITIGIIGKNPFGNALDSIKGKRVKDRKVVIKRFKGFKEPGETGEKDESELRRKIEALRKCHLLFICSSEKKNLKEIMNSVKDHSVLTIGETKDFLESGGIINFLIEEKKIRFEINITAAKKAKLKIRSNLLKLAKRVVKEKPSEKAKS